MSIAWATIALLVLLLPGFLFFVGLSFPEKFTRETVARSPLGQLAGTVSVSLGVHSTLYLLLYSLFGRWVPYPRLEYVFSILQLEGSKALSLADLAANVEEFRWWIGGYMLLSCLLGVGAGWFTGRQVVRGRWRFLAQHRWVFDLAVEQKEGYTTAYVLTHVREGDRALMYKGFVKHFGLAPDGRFTYLVLKDCRKLYLVLEKTAPKTTPVEDWRALGQEAKRAAAPPAKEPSAEIVVSYLMIEGEDIANVVFDSYKLVATPKGSTILDNLLLSEAFAKGKDKELKDVMEELLKTLTDKPGPTGPSSTR